MSQAIRTVSEQELSPERARVGVAPVPHTVPRVTRRLGVDWRDLRERSVFFAMWSIGGSVAMAAWKIGAAVLVGGSLFWLSNAAFSVGIAVAKSLAVVAHRQGRTGKVRGPANRVRAQHRIYRTAGAAVCVLAALYVVSCLTMVFGGGASESYDTYSGIAIATLTFTELGMAIAGVVSARRNSDVVVEVIKLANLAGALILLALTQTALMSFSSEDGAPAHLTGVAGVFFGSGACVIGVYMLVRPLPCTVGEVSAARGGIRRRNRGGVRGRIADRVRGRGVGLAALGGSRDSRGALGRVFRPDPGLPAPELTPPRCRGRRRSPERDRGAGPA
ncbi:hypothetical protein [Propionicicella superfundia]|uniref:hypothetical protein n=1 Tax=Propionicicella superfundia TaxID=348582 RepID=UPI0003FECA26|nr:hypothetical protein [Propionicicella superfundia]